MDLAQRFQVGTLVYVLASVIVNASESHRLYGLDAPEMWLPGSIAACRLVETDKGRRMKKVAAQWFTGHGKHVIKTIAISNTKLTPPPGTKLPDEIGDRHESLLRRPTPAPPCAREQERQVAAAATDPLRRVTMLQQYNLPSDKEFRSIPSPTTSLTTEDDPEARTVRANETKWEEDDKATRVEINGPSSNRTWSVKDGVGNFFGNRSDTLKSYTGMDYWLLMFPPKALQHALNQTNQCVWKKGKGGDDDGRAHLVLWSNHPLHLI